MRERAPRAHTGCEIRQVAPYQGSATHTLAVCSCLVGMIDDMPLLQVLISCSYDDTIKLWADDQDDWYCLDTLSGHTSTVWEVALSKDGGRMGMFP